MTFVGSSRDNPQDPLKNDGPASRRELYSQMSRICDGFPNDAVINAAGNVLVNALRHSNKNCRQAEAAFDELAAKLKTLLLDKHYDHLGQRRSIFPFAQTIETPLLHKPKQ